MIFTRCLSFDEKEFIYGRCSEGSSELLFLCDEGWVKVNGNELFLFATFRELCFLKHAPIYAYLIFMPLNLIRLLLALSLSLCLVYFVFVGEAIIVKSVLRH